MPTALGLSSTIHHSAISWQNEQLKLIYWGTENYTFVGENVAIDE
jgi:hypothetical protein